MESHRMNLEIAGTAWLPASKVVEVSYPGAGQPRTTRATRHFQLA